MTMTEENPALTGLSNGPDPGCAPGAGLSLLVEGWRHIPHSYSLFNQSQCLEIERRGDVSLYFQDAPAIPQLGGPVRGLLSDCDEKRIESMRPPPRGTKLDAVYRAAYPADPSASSALRTFVFANCDRLIVRDSEWRKQAGRTFAESLARSDATLITPSEWCRTGFIRSGVRPSRVVVVPHGIDPEVHKPIDPEVRDAERKKLLWDDKFVFLNVSALTGNKNPLGILEAFAMVVRKHPHARLVLKGLNQIHHSDHWMAGALAMLSPATRALVAKHLIFTGEAMSTADVAGLYQKADAYISPYQSEGFNIPVLEAFACGLPVIVTSGGSTDDFTHPDFTKYIPSVLGDHSHDGGMWLKTDPNDIAAKMEEAILDPGWCATARDTGPFHAHNNFAWPRVVEWLLTVIRTEIHHLKGIPCQK